MPRLLIRIVLLLAMIRLGVQAVIGYAFDFKDGYPLWPLLGLAGCFWAYLHFQPQDKRLNISYRAESLDSSLFLLLAVACSAFVLDRRGEALFTLPYFWHLSVLTLFQLLLPFIVATCLRRAQLLTTAISALLLMFFLYKGSEQKAEPVLDYLESASAYQRANPTPDPLTAPQPAPASIARKQQLQQQQHPQAVAANTRTRPQTTATTRSPGQLSTKH